MEKKYACGYCKQSGITSYPKVQCNWCSPSGIFCGTGHDKCTRTALFTKKTSALSDKCLNECGTTNRRCNCLEGVSGVNPEISEPDIIDNKKKRVLEAITTLKQTIYSNIKGRYKDLFTKTTEEQYKEYFRKLSESALTKSEQVLLLDQISTEFVENNALNLFINVQNIISKNNQPVDNTKIKEIIRQTMKNVLPNIITSFNYGEDFLKMNYTNAYQTMYYAVSLYLYKFKWPIIYPCYTIYLNKE